MERAEIHAAFCMALGIISDMTHTNHEEEREDETKRKIKKYISILLHRVGFHFLA